MHYILPWIITFCVSMSRQISNRNAKIRYRADSCLLFSKTEGRQWVQAVWKRKNFWSAWDSAPRYLPKATYTLSIPHQKRVVTAIFFLCLTTDFRFTFPHKLSIEPPNKPNWVESPGFFNCGGSLNPPIRLEILERDFENSLGNYGKVPWAGIL